MTPSRVGIVLVLVAVAAPWQQEAPTFRAAADEVLVDVSVIDGRGPVQGLGASDFILIDNGVPQQLSEVTHESGPIDVALVVQREGNRAGLPSMVMPSIDHAVRAAEADIRATLLDGDHLDVRGAERLRDPPGGLSGGRQRQLFRSNILDELTAALMLAPSAPGRRRLVIAVTGGVVDRSIVPEETRLEVARRSDAVMHLVTLGDRSQSNAFAQAGGGVLTVFGRAALPLEPLSDASGGRTYRQDPSANITAVLGRAITEFRTRYLLRYTVTGVPREGWHEVEVSVPSGDYDVRHRRGYEIPSGR